MKNAIIAGARQLLFKRLLSCIIAVCILIFLTLAKELMQTFPLTSVLSYGYHTSLIQNGLKTDTICSFIPIISVLPFAACYIDDIKSKFARFYLIRIDYRDYLWSRIVVCFFSGGGPILTGSLLSWGISALLFRPMEIAVEKGAISTVSIWPKLVLLFLAGGLWAVVGMAMSTLMESKYIAYASPFVIYYILVILCERYFPDAFLLYPPNWTNPEVWPYGAWGAAIFLIEITLVFSILFVSRAGRRLREL